LQGEGDAPGQADEVLGLEDRMMQAALAGVGAPVGIAEHQPEHAVGAEHAAHLTEDFDQGGDISLRRGLAAELARTAGIIA
jgi:hypothetical protein